MGLGRILAKPITAASMALLISGGTAAAPPPGLEAALSYPFEDALVSAMNGETIAWVRTVKGVRNVWIARGPAFVPRQLTRNTADDGQELSGLAFSPDGSRLVWVRGGDHDANWPADGGLQPNPAGDTAEPKVTIWTAPVAGGAPVQVTEGDEPALSARGVLAFIRDHQAWTAPLDGKGAAERLFFDRGHVGELAWSPGGDRLAFVSDRGDHAFVGVFTARDQPLVYLAPSTSRDASPRWSLDGARIAFTRRQGRGGAPVPMLEQTPEPWAIWTASAAGDDGRRVWQSPDTLDGSFPDTDGEANLLWAAGDRLVFLADLDGWPHLYSVPAAGGLATLLTPGAFMVEHVTRSPDGREVLYAANTGGVKDDGDRRHIFEVSVAGGPPKALSGGATVDWTPVAMEGGEVAYIAAGVSAPPAVTVVNSQGTGRRIVADAGTPPARLIEPKSVAFTAPDGLTVHGQLFRTAGGGAKPGVIFVHGGPPRQMLLGWHYMDYYSNAYAMNQYLAAHGFVVLSVNYRLGIGYGRAYMQPAHGGPAGAAEYQDVLAGARYLQGLPGVDPARIGIWGGSYGGLLTGLALARNSDVFKAGVDWHGVHDWSRDLYKDFLAGQPRRFETGDRDKALAVAFASSPDADVKTWTSPVLLIQGDDDRNVEFAQTIDLARRLEAQHTPFEELVIPGEIHGFLQHRSWLAADAATVDFLDRKLGVAGQ